MIKLQPLAESRQFQADLIHTPSKDSGKVHRLGGFSRASSLKQPGRTLKQPIKQTPNTQQAVLTFSSFNPFYHIHQAIHQQPAKTQPGKKCLQDVIREVYEMKEFSQKLVTPHKEQQRQECQKTMIMDLQNLQTNRVDLEKVQSELHESHISIKQQLPQGQNLCLHGQCEQINSVLKKALERMDELQEENLRLKKVLEDYEMSKQLAENDNLFLREEIARVDEQKCAEINILRQEVDKLKRQKENCSGDAPIYEIGRLPVQNVCQKGIRQMDDETQRPALAAIQSNLKNSILIPCHRQKDAIQQSIKKLKHAVYL